MIFNLESGAIVHGPSPYHVLFGGISHILYIVNGIIQSSRLRKGQGKVKGRLREGFAFNKQWEGYRKVIERLNKGDRKVMGRFYLNCAKIRERWNRYRCELLLSYT